MTLGYIIAFLILGIMVASSFIFAITVSKNEALLRKRLKELEDSNIDISEMSKNSSKTIADLPLSERLLYPYIIRMSNIMKKFTPKSYIDKLNADLVTAGNPKGMTATEFLGIQGLFSIVMPVIFLVVLMIAGGKPSTNILISVVVMLFGYVFPRFWLGNLIKERKDKIQKMLPFTLDLLNVSVDAGLGFDSAMDRVSHSLDGPIADEFSQVLTEIRLGKSRKDALRNMVERTDVKDLNQFVVAIIQADKLGVGLSKLLKVQSQQMRQSAKQRAQEKAFKAPVKMLFPMIIFIFPAIFVILLGPAALYLPDVFGGM